MAKGRQFTSLSAEDQQIIANGLSRPDGGSWRHNWQTNDIDNEFTTMDKWHQDFLLMNMDAARKRILTQQLQFDTNQAAADKAWADYGGAPAGAMGVKGSQKGTTGYVPKKDGSDAWKFKGSDNPSNMKNPQFINGRYYDMPKTTSSAAPAASAASADPANLSGGQPTVPSVASRMSRMGQAVLKGVGKGAIGMNQLGKYIPPGTTLPTAPTAPTKPTAPASPLLSQLESGKKTPVPMPQKSSVKA